MNTRGTGDIARGFVKLGELHAPCGGSLTIVKYFIFVSVHGKIKENFVKTHHMT
jgi:hypothetical protein